MHKAAYLYLILVILGLTARPIHGDTYPIDWGLVEVDPAPRAIDYTSDIGPCQCDLTRNVCDVNCRCDPDCTPEEIARFSRALKEGAPTTTITKCVDADLVQLNRRGKLIPTVIDNVLCVSIDNNPSKGTYFPEPEPVTDSKLTAYHNAITSFQESAPSSVVDESDQLYRSGQAIGAAIDGGSSGLFQINGGYLSLPASNAFGECSDANYVQYLSNNKSQCSRTTTSFASQCQLGASSPLAAQFRVDNVMVAKYRNSIPSAADQYIGLTISAASLYDASTNTLTPLTPSALPVPSWDAATCECSNVLLEMHYNLSDSSISGSIAVASASLILGTVKGSGAGCETAQFTQSFSSYFDMAPSARPIPLSGNPGYVSGGVVLGGVLASAGNKKAISQSKEGITLLPTDSAGLCSPTGQATPVMFGEELNVGCFVPLTLAQLQATCSVGVAAYLSQTLTHVGVWGNSDYENPTDWLTIDKDSETPVASFDAGLRRCSNIINSYNLEIITADVGNVLNPQRRIMRAHVRTTTTTWQYRSLDPTTVERFPLRATVTFIHQYPDGLVEYVPPGPPILPNIPEDLLYPLQIGSSSRGAPANVLLMFLSLLLLALSFIIV